MYQNIDFHLVPDSANFAILKGGENLLHEINFQISDTSMVVKNKNKCNFLRTYKKHLYAEIHFNHLSRVEFAGSYPLSNEDTIHADIFNLLIHEGAGTVNLTIDANSSNGLITEGAGDFYLNGNVGFAVMEVDDNGYCDITNLHVASWLEVKNYSTGNMKCNFNGSDIEVTIASTGSILFEGDPKSMQQNITGTGKLIKTK